MPRVMYPHLLRAVYNAATHLIEQRRIPTEIIPASATLFRSFDQKHARINTDGVFPRASANAALEIRDQGVDRNRFTGQSFTAGIPAFGGLYCSLQAQAIVNEMSYYARASPGIPRDARSGFPNVHATLRGMCVVRIRLMSSVLAADISAHNPGSAAFLEALNHSPDVQAALRIAGRGGQSVSRQVSESEDCSAARGIGLAVANTPWLRALKATTVRPSERSPEEMGDNLIFFGHNDDRVPALWIDQAYLFPLSGAPVICSVEFAAST